MKRLLCVLAVLLGGCSEDFVSGRRADLTTTPLRLNDKACSFVTAITVEGEPRGSVNRTAYLQVLAYEGKRHVFLRTFQGGLSKVGEYPIDPESKQQEKTK